MFIVTALSSIVILSEVSTVVYSALFHRHHQQQHPPQIQPNITENNNNNNISDDIIDKLSMSSSATTVFDHQDLVDTTNTTPSKPPTNNNTNTTTTITHTPHPLSSPSRHSQLTFTHAPIAMARCNGTGEIVDVNRKWVEMCQSTYEECLGNSWMTNIDENDIDRTLSRWSNFIAASQRYDPASSTDPLPYYENETKGYSSDGSILYSTRSTASPYWTENKELGLIVILEDMTDLHNALERAEEGIRIKKEFVSTLTHECRTPLHGILGLSTILRDTKLSTEQDDLLRSLTGCATNLLSIVNDVLDFSKFESGKIELDIRPVSIRTLLQSVYDLLGVTARSKNVDFKYHLFPSSTTTNPTTSTNKAIAPSPSESRSSSPTECSSPTDMIVFLDEHKVRRVLVNLVSNSCKFVEKGGCVEFSATMDPDRPFLRFTVLDNGPGIPETSFHRLFQSFSQLDSSASRKHEGTGLGLAISRSLVEVMHGKIWVEPVSPKFERGATFCFEIPVRLGASPDLIDSFSILRRDQNRIQSIAKDDECPLSILVAEDNVINQKVIVKFLSRLGFPNVDVAENGLIALEYCQSKNYHLVFMDLLMPIMDGFESSKRIRAMYIEKKVELPFMCILSANVDQLDSADEKFEFDAFVTKPLKMEELIRVIKKAQAKVKVLGMEQQ